MHIKQNLSRLVILMLIVMNLVTLTRASETAKILTLERAISGGIDCEERIGVISKQIQAAEETLKITSNIGSSLYQTTRINRDSLIQEQDFIKDIVAYNVTKLYQNISYTQKQVQFSTLQVELAQKALRQIEIKRSKGKVSDLELEQARVQLKEAMANKTQNQTNLADYKGQFLRLTNIQVDRYDGLEEILTYTPLQDQESAKGIISKGIDLYLKSQERLAAYKKNNILNIAEENSGGLAPSSAAVYNSEADAANTEYTAKKTREQMLNSLNTCYANLQTLQETLNTLKLKQETSKKNYEAAQIKYAHGYISELQLQNIESTMLQEALQYESTLMNDIQMKMYLEKPWVN